MAVVVIENAHSDMGLKTGSSSRPESGKITYIHTVLFSPSIFKFLWLDGYFISVLFFPPFFSFFCFSTLPFLIAS